MAVAIHALGEARDVTAAARHILRQAPERFVLVGFSLGGIIALEIASIAPDRVAGLVLLDSNAREVDPADHAARREAALLGARDLARHISETLWPVYVGQSARTDESLRARLIAMAAKCGPQALLAQTEIALSRPDSRPRLHGLTMPALVIAGREDVLNPPDMQRELADGLPAATLELIDGAGHFALLEATDAVACSVAKWLRRDLSD